MLKYPWDSIAYMYFLYESFYPDLTADPIRNGKRTREDLLAKMANAAGIDQATADKALDGFLGEVNRRLSKRDTVTLVGFGTFSVVKRSALMGRNPQTGKWIYIPARKVPKFVAAKALKEAIK